jgi:branched-chain amino acid transport system substrate-binding protein
LKAQHLVNVWGFDKNLYNLAGKGANGIIGATVCGFIESDVPLMDTVRAYAKKYNPSIPLEKRLIHTVKAWANVMVLAEALKRADAKGDLSGESILKNGFETMRDFDIGLGAAPITYTSDDHRPGSVISVYQLTNGKFSLFDKVDLKKRWSYKWENEWLGW